jgi:hypothetical protein
MFSGDICNEDVVAAGKNEPLSLVEITKGN